MPDNPTFLIAVGVQVLVFWFALALRETAKAAAADRFGDPGLRESGRVSLNPLAHFDLFGTLMVPVLMGLVGGPVFGWGKRAEVDFPRLHDNQRGSIWIFLAGPLANLLLAVVSLLLFALVMLVLGEAAGQSALLSQLGRYEQAATFRGFPLLFLLERTVRLNAFLFVFHLLPFPPLDGGWLAMQYLPRHWALRLVGIEPYGRLVGMMVAILGGVELVLLPVTLAVVLVMTF